MSRHTQPLVWATLAALTVVLHALSGPLTYLVTYPDAWVASPTDAMNAGMQAFVGVFGPMFKVVGSILEWPIWAAQNVLRIVPWSVVALLFVVLGYAASGWRLAPLWQYPCCIWPE